MRNVAANLMGLIVIGLTLNAPLGFCQVELGIDPKLKADNYLKQGNPSRAIEEYQKALALKPSSTAAYFNLAIAYYAVRDIGGAVSALEKLVALDPEDVEAHYNLGCLKLYLHDQEGAKTHFEKAKNCCRHNPAFVPLIDKGLKFIDQLGQTDPSTQDILFFLLQYGLPPVPLIG